jgi:phosphatidylglycerophosphate synthase
MKSEKINTIPNFLTLSRIIILIIMWFFFFKEQKTTIGILLIIALSTDFLDGFLARKLNQETKFGAKFDSIADNILGLSIIIWIPFLLKEMFFNNITIISITIGLTIISWLIATIKFKRNPQFHLISNKISVIIGGTFIIHSLIFNYNKILLYLTLLTFIYVAIEELIITIKNKDINENIKSVFQIK